MTGDHRISIDSEGIAGLGARLGDIATYLEDKATLSNAEGVRTYGFPTAYGSDGYETALGDFERVRVAACKQLRDLRDLARGAGGCYVETEQLLDRRNRGIL